MKPEIKDKWLAALRSGEYLQGAHRLKRTDADGQTAYCCLGVLCDLAVKEGVIPEPVNIDLINDNPVWSYGITGEGDDRDSSWTTLPDSVQEWAGLHENDPVVGPSRLCISTYNDRHGLDFEDIADLIDRYL